MAALTITNTQAATFSSTLGVTGITTLSNTTATPAGGSAAASVLLGTTAAFGLYYGSGLPTFSAAQGSMYLRSDGSGITTRMYVATNSAGTWTNVTTVA